MLDFEIQYELQTLDKNRKKIYEPEVRISRAFRNTIIANTYQVVSDRIRGVRAG